MFGGPPLTLLLTLLVGPWANSLKGCSGEPPYPPQKREKSKPSRVLLCGGSLLGCFSFTSGDAFSQQGGEGAGQMLRPFSDVGHRVRSGQAGVLLATTWSIEEMKSDIEGNVVTKSPCSFQEVPFIIVFFPDKLLARQHSVANLNFWAHFLQNGRERVGVRANPSSAALTPPIFQIEN